MARYPRAARWSRVPIVASQVVTSNRAPWSSTTAAPLRGSPDPRVDGAGVGVVHGSRGRGVGSGEGRGSGQGHREGDPPGPCPGSGGAIGRAWRGLSYPRAPRSVPRCHPDLVRSVLRSSHRCPAPGLGGHRLGARHLIAAPTGSGKTLAAFLVAIDDLLRRSEEGTLADEVDVLYVSPLKALSADIQRNLDAPLAGIGDVVAEAGARPEIRTALRTGDTPATERQRILRRPPHVLITTPESLYLLLTAAKSREILRTVRTVVVDEIHALIGSKRGSHLALSLARLDHVCDVRPTRIGLSATQRPIELTTRFLVGAPADREPDCEVVDTGHRRDLDLAIEVPPTELEAVCSHEQWSDVYERIVALVREHRTTLIFVNTRRLAERLAHQLGEQLGEEAVAAHHGSLSRRTRLELERRLKEGELSALVATASLELGIDVGSIDLVCQIDSPGRSTPSSSASDGPGTPSGRRPGGACSRPPATAWSSARPWCARSGRGGSTASGPRSAPSTSWPSRWSRRRRPSRGPRTVCSSSCVAPSPTGTWSAGTSTG